MLGRGKSTCKNPAVGSSLLDFLESPLQEGALTTTIVCHPPSGPSKAMWELALEQAGSCPTSSQGLSPHALTVCSLPAVLIWGLPQGSGVLAWKEPVTCGKLLRGSSKTPNLPA